MMIATIVFSAVTAITAVIALFLTLKQIKLSNKQHLFDYRLEAYCFFKNILRLYKNFEKTHDDWYLDVESFYYQMIDCIELKELIVIIRHPLSERKKFLNKMVWFESKIEEYTILWKNKSGVLAREFMEKYHELILKVDLLYLYSNYLNDKTDDDLPQIYGIDKSDYNLLKNKIRNKAEEIELLSVKENLDDCFKNVLNGKVPEKLYKEIII